jgi:hypothetical protein
LPRFLIRNAKQKATDMKGNRLFMPIEQYPETFTYSPEEESFYELMSSFIMAGKAYASSLGKVEGGQVMLVLIALQKLASSSVAAVLSALETRRGRLVSLAAKTRAELESQTDDPAADEGARVFEEWLRDEKRSRIQLMEDEGRHLDDLLASGRAVLSETRVVRVMEVISNRFADQPVLLFTEYKRTQALVVAALMERFGRGVCRVHEWRQQAGKCSTSRWPPDRTVGSARGHLRRLQRRAAQVSCVDRSRR